MSRNKKTFDHCSGNKIKKTLTWPSCCSPAAVGSPAPWCCCAASRGWAWTPSSRWCGGPGRRRGASAAGRRPCRWTAAGSEVRSPCSRGAVRKWREREEVVKTDLCQKCLRSQSVGFQTKWPFRSSEFTSPLIYNRRYTVYPPPVLDCTPRRCQDVDPTVAESQGQ